ncbi:MAG: LamG domain-containing protein [Planctomycetota bacterium]|jgi:hypothetical protein
MSKKMYFLISFVLLLSLVTSASAYDTVAWDNGGGDRLWDNVANWDLPSTGSPSDEKVPDFIDWVWIDDNADGNNGPIIDANTDAVAQWIGLGEGKSPAGGAEAVLTMTGGTLTATGWFELGGYYSGTFRFDLSGSDVNVPYIWVGYEAGSYATMNMSGGTIQTETALSIGTQDTVQGDVNMTGGYVNLGGWLEIGSYNTGPGNGHLDLKGGTIENRLLAMGGRGGGVGTMDLSGGTLIIDGDYRVPNGWLFDPCSDDANTLGGDCTGTIAILAKRGLITAYHTNIGDIITDGNHPSVVGLRSVVNLDYDVTNPGQTTLTAGAVDPNLAWDPDPLFGSGGLSAADVNRLSWTAGDNALSHQVYFGTGFTEVDSADSTDTTGIYKATQSLTEVNYPVSVTWDKTYYWRIDEVNAATAWKGTVWNFVTIPAWATNPSPANNATDVSPTSAILSWAPGPVVATHNVYFSSDFNDVNDRDTSVKTVRSEPNFNPGNLDLDKLYYWAVDEVNNLEDPNVWLSPVWRFTTADYLTVDDFDSYANQTALWNVWDDYWVNTTGSEIFDEADVNFVRGDSGKSLRFVYDCGVTYKKVGAKIDADAVDLDVGTDWTYGGAKAMQIFFLGDPCNGVTENDRMWVELEDTSSNAGVLLYDGDPNNVKKDDTWTTWHIDLAFFDACGVSLANVSKVHIGFGGVPIGQSKAGGSGTVYFDDIRLRPPYCRSGLVLTDFTGDCITDELDLDVMAGDWLEYDYNVPAVAISGTPVGWWKLDEGMGATTADSSANSNHGDITHASWTVGYPNDPCDSGLHFDGDGIAKLDRVVVAELEGNSPGTYPAELMPAAFTVACWVKLDNFNYYGTFVAAGDDYGTSGNQSCGFYLYGNNPGGSLGDRDLPASIGTFGLGTSIEGEGMYYVATPSIYETDTWYHVAATYDDDANTVAVYVDGKLSAGPTDVGGPIRWINPITSSYPDQFAIGGLPVMAGQDWFYVVGTIDEVRLYGYAMPHGEVDYGLMADHWLEGPTLWP